MMNKRIKELASQAWVDNDHLDACGYTDLKKFAELIVGECVKVAMRSVSDDEPKEAWYLIQEHFGVEE
jgi:hypothetical protein